MRLGLNLSFLGQLGSCPPPHIAIELVRAAERLGYSIVWTAEAFGSDAVSMLGWLVAQTDRIGLGSAAMQIPGRTPALTAMTATTLDLLSGGRFHLGLGVSSPQVTENWHGVAFDRPLARTREYIDVVRLAMGRQRLAHEGDHYRIPPDSAVRLNLRPVRATVPIYLAAVGPRNVELAGEIADGWLSVFFAPEAAAELTHALHAGRRRSGRTPDDFDLVVTAPVVLGEDPAACADEVRVYSARYLGIMGDYYSRHAARMGYATAAAAVREKFRSGDVRGAAAAVPMRLLEDTCLLGPVPAIAERLRAYADAGVRTLSVLAPRGSVDEGVATLRGVAEALDKSGVGD